MDQEEIRAQVEEYRADFALRSIVGIMAALIKGADMIVTAMNPGNNYSANGDIADRAWSLWVAVRKRQPMPEDL